MPTMIRYWPRVGTAKPSVDLDLALEHCIQYMPFDAHGNSNHIPDSYYYEFPDGLWLHVHNPDEPRDRWLYAQINPIFVMKLYLSNAHRKPINGPPLSLRKYDAYRDCRTFCQWMIDQALDPWIGLDHPPVEAPRKHADPCKSVQEDACEYGGSKSPNGMDRSDSATVDLPIVLGGISDEPTVLGKPKKRLTQGQYHVVKALLDAHPDRLSKDVLAIRSKTEEPVKMIDRLRRDKDWAKVLDKPGQAHGGYGIRVTTPKRATTRKA